MVSKRLKKFLEADAEMKKCKEIVDKDKPYIKKLIRRAKSFGINVPGVSIFTRSGRITINEDEVYEYLKGLCMEPLKDDKGQTVLGKDGNPELAVNQEKLSMFCREVVDLSKIQTVASHLNLEVLPLPSFCYTVEDDEEILRIDRKRLQ